MPFRWLFLLAAVAALPSWAQEKLYVQVPAAYDPQAWAVRQVKDQCALAAMVGNQVFSQVQRGMPQAAAIETPADASGARVLRLTIVNIFGIGGGGWTGPKALTMRAELVRGAEVLGTFERREESRGGILGPVTGTCGIFEGIAETLGQEIARWLPGVSAGRSEPEKKP